jgi:hypothetical protein
MNTKWLDLNKIMPVLPFHGKNIDSYYSFVGTFLHIGWSTLIEIGISPSPGGDYSVNLSMRFLKSFIHAIWIPFKQILL